jgi:general secretion pathway protein K
MALLLVLMIVAMLAALLTEFAFSTLVDLRLTETFRDSTRAYYLAKGGVTVGRVILQNDPNIDYDAKDEMWAQGLPNYPVGDGVVSIFIEDEGGKLDVNSLLETSGEVRKRFYRLFDAMDLDAEALTGALIDWIDPNDDPYIDPDSNEMIGTERDYYLRQSPPYQCKNAPLDSLEELALIRGFSREIRNLVTPHLTVHGENDKLININTASKEVLAAIFVRGTVELPEAESAAETVLQVRESAPIKDLAKLDLGVVSKAGFKSKSDTYLIKTEGGVGDGVRRIEAFVQKTGDKLLYIKVN